MPVRWKRPTLYAQILVELRLTQPRVWRRLAVRDDMSLGFLHCMLQIAMGWTHSHLHRFLAGREMFGNPDLLEDDLLDAPKEQDENRVLIREFSVVPGIHLLYEYDFGDSWFHDIRIEGFSHFEQGKGRTPLALCLEGERAGPPEDCGGPPGFFDLVKAMKKGSGTRYQQVVDWLGRPFNPEQFDLALINECLARLKTRPPSQTELARILRFRDQGLYGQCF